MGRTITEKIFSKYAEKTVAAGEIVEVPVHRLMFMDWKGPSVFEHFEADLGQDFLPNPDRIVMVSDHLGLGHDIANAQILESFKQHAEKYHIQHFYGIGRTGICHQVMVEDGLVTPGTVTLGCDSHSTTYGALGCFACGISASEVACIMAREKMWFSIPPTIRIVLTGSLPFGCYGKDVALKILSILRCDEDALYKAIEITGEGVQSLNMDDRLTLCNMMAETGAKNCVVPVDGITEAYLADKIHEPYEKFISDDDAVFDATHTIDLNLLVPLIAVPPSVCDVRPVSELEGLPISRVFLGTCASGRLLELGVSAAMLKDKEIPKSVSMIVVPASRSIYIECAKCGYIESFAQAGAAFESSTCASCSGRSSGVLPAGAVCVSTANRNFNGRMGSFEASIYLASAATATASALHGRITDPRNDLRKISNGGKGDD